MMRLVLLFITTAAAKNTLCLRQPTYPQGTPTQIALNNANQPFVGPCNQTSPIRYTAGALPPQCSVSQPIPFCTCTGRDANDLAIQALSLQGIGSIPFYVGYQYSAAIDILWQAGPNSVIETVMYVNGVQFASRESNIADPSHVAWNDDQRGPGFLGFTLVELWDTPSSGAQYFWEQSFIDSQANTLLCIRTGIYTQP